jgi:hypothetical protein|tara:strand:- start:279 stop:701 length:423 start_codon:yes stop_codon:yes gene_type:complete
MKRSLKLIGVLLGIVFLYGAFTLSLSELGGEVVTLVRPEPEGSTKNIRVWIVDTDGKAWIEHGDNESFWIKQLVDNSQLSIIREGKENKYLASADKESHDFYHNLRREKYTFADKMLDILTFGATSKDNCSGIPIRLELL